MDLDAILFFYNRFNNLDYNENDIMIMSSYISNNLIDINKSIMDNICEYINSTESNIVLSQFDFDNQTLSIPIYRLLLQEYLMHSTLLTAIQKGLLTDEAYKDIVESLIDSVDKILPTEQERILPFIIDVLQSKKNADSEVMQDSKIIREFVSNNKEVLALNKRVKNRGDLLQKKIIIIRLFANSYVRYGNFNDVIINYEDIINPLIETENYGQLRLVIGNKVIDIDDVDYILELINKRVQSNINLESQESVDNGERIISETTMMLKLFESSRRNV